MTDLFPAMIPMRKNCKQLQKIGQYLLKCHNHLPISIINLSNSDLNLVPVLSCHFFPVRVVFEKLKNIFKNVFIVNPMDYHSNSKFQKM